MREGLEEHFMTTDEGIVTRDIWDVQRADAVLFNLLNAKKISIGTMVEYGWASAFNKPIITVMEKRGSKKENIHEHPMVRRASGYRVETLEQGLTVVKALFAY
jgi:nucleoside 2-deoxyribosyltransferase